MENVQAMYGKILQRKKIKRSLRERKTVQWRKALTRGFLLLENYFMEKNNQTSISLSLRKRIRQS